MAGDSDRNRPHRGRLSRLGRTVAAALALACGGMALLSAPVIGDGLNRGPDPASPRVAATVPATDVQVAGAGIDLRSAAVSNNARKKRAKARQRAKAKRKRQARMKPVMMRSRITTDAILTEEGRGTYVGIRCPAGAKAVAGGAFSQYINLLVSSSAPNNPITGKYTPRVWWVTVTNSNIDGQGGSLSWRGVVTCLSPLRLGK